MIIIIINKENPFYFFPKRKSIYLFAPEICKSILFLVVLWACDRPIQGKCLEHPKLYLLSTLSNDIAPYTSNKVLLATNLLLLCVADLTLATVFIFYFINLPTYYISFLMFIFSLTHIQTPMAYFLNLLNSLTHHDEVKKFD